MKIPWSNLYSGLNKYWWHRLAKVVYTIALVVLLPLIIIGGILFIEEESQVGYYDVQVVDRLSNYTDKHDPNSRGEMRTDDDLDNGFFYNLNYRSGALNYSDATFVSHNAVDEFLDHNQNIACVNSSYQSFFDYSEYVNNVKSGDYTLTGCSPYNLSSYLIHDNHYTESVIYPLLFVCVGCAILLIVIPMLYYKGLVYIILGEKQNK